MGIGRDDETFMIIIDKGRLFSLDELAAAHSTSGTHLDIEITDVAA